MVGVGRSFSFEWAGYALTDNYCWSGNGSVDMYEFSEDLTAGWCVATVDERTAVTRQKICK